VPLNLKAFEILLVLIRNRGQILEKDELFKQVWPNTVVEENNLARNISALRKALDELPNEHQFILTVPGRGYRFVADVREVEENSADLPVYSARRVTDELVVVTNGNLPTAAEVPKVETVEPLLSRPTQPKRMRFAIISAALLIATVTVISVVIYLFPKSARTDTSVPQPNLWQLTFDPGLESEPTWSPDGRFIAYSSDRSGNFDIWVQPVGEGNAIRVTNSTAHDWQPDWAPEGNRLVFRSERDGGGLFVVPALGGNERKVSSFGYRPRWSPDGTQILFYSSILSNNTVEIPRVYLVGLDGKPPRDVLTGFLADFDSVRVAWHPDG
jgi:DNA-binding winged helix-turn-helix (wHTH) protein